MRYFILFLLFFFAYPYDTLWFRRFDTGTNEYGSSSTIDPEGNIILAPVPEDWSCIFIVKYSSSGEIIWTRNFNINGSPRGLACDKEGNIIIIGRWQEPHRNVHVIKFSPDGETLWSRRLELGEYGALYGVTIDDSNNIIVSGTLTESNDEDIILAKFSPSGDLIWQRIYDLGWNDWEGLYSVTLDKEGNIIGTGDYGLLDNTYFLTMKFDKNGTLIWQKSLDFEEIDTGHDIAVDSSNNIYACGVVGHDWDIFSILIKYAPNGETLFTRKYITRYENLPWGIAIDQLGNILITGVVVKETMPRYSDCFLLKYSSNGESLFSHHYNFAFYMGGEDINLDNLNHIYISGWIGENNNRDIYLMKLLYLPAINEKKIISLSKNRYFTEIFDITGKKIKVSKISSKGVYFLKEAKEIKKIIIY
ncbi:MAG: hypothetical protein N2323_00880 [candidate division WOR-3 bacterium]|nr:hypothetical protein [candidate division WOR-3 bacterium]MCX7836500.1 hypothetical protein [candidate division WOR-3 bacterium]MDW8114439.1 hypothetical protein [candidate division WOR-3 bacterium]